MTKAIKILTDFTEGSLSDKDFEQQLYTNSALEKLLSDSAINWHGTYLHNTNPYLYLSEQNYKSYAGRLNAYGAVKLFLTKIGLEVTPSTKYEDEYNLLLNASPTYVDAEPSFVEKYILPVDKTLSAAHQKQFIKRRYAELFKYQTRPPKWIQNPDWPIKAEKPLFFLGQLEVKNCAFFHDDGAIYLFLDTETGSIETVQQVH